MLCFHVLYDNYLVFSLTICYIMQFRGIGEGVFTHTFLRLSSDLQCFFSALLFSANHHTLFLHIKQCSFQTVIRLDGNLQVCDGWGHFLPCTPYVTHPVRNGGGRVLALLNCHIVPVCAQQLLFFFKPQPEATFVNASQITQVAVCRS